jgi:type I restriction enzyme S subunit
MTPERWPIVCVGDIASKKKNALVGGPFGSNLVSADYVPAGVPVIRGQNMSSGRFVSGEFACISAEKAESLSPNTARPGDVVFTQRGTLGQVAIVPPEPYQQYIISQSQMKLTVDRGVADPLFVYYVFTSNEQQDYIRRNAIQTGVPHTNLEILRNTPIQLPSLKEQEAIASALGALDNQIESNRRMNETLESMARAIFKSWFVDFDPVRAKAEGRQPAGMDAETAALFPSAFIDSANGPVPTSWSLSIVESLTSLLNRGITPAYVENGGVLVLNQKCVRDHRVNIDFGRRHDPSVRSVVARQLAVGDILVNSTGQGTLGRVAQLFYLPEQATVDTHVTIVRANPLRSSVHFLGLELIGRELEIEALAEGTTGQTELSRTRLGSLHVIVPPISIQAEFDKIIDPIRTQITVNHMQSDTLAAIRDALLPKLLSGEIRIRDAEKLVEAQV